MTSEMTYKGITIVPKYNAEDRKFSAEVLVEKGVAYVSGETVEELEKQFHDMVDVLAEKGRAKPRPQSFMQRAAKFLKSA